MRHKLPLLLIAACLLVPGSAAIAKNPKFHVLYSFCADANCADGGLPGAGLVMDQARNLYGVTTYSGASGQNDAGTVFELVPGGKKWKHKTLYSFCSQPNCADGSDPTGTPIVDMAGNLYGTTRKGGANGAGVAFELMPNATGKKWKLKVLYDFCSVGGGACTDGGTPVAGLAYAGAQSGAAYDGASPLFGTGSLFGAHNAGVVFKLEPGRKKWHQTVLYPFCSQASCDDGSGPHSDLVVDAQGNLFGTTSLGGSQWFQAGVVFRVDSAGNETVLYAFCPSGNCPDGAGPHGGVLVDASGNILGTTYNGGANGTGLLDGTVFQIDGSGEHVLYNFCAKQNCADGAFPSAGLVQDSSGRIFGTARYGGAGGGSSGGTVFQLDGATVKVLHAFCSESGCADGSDVSSGVICDPAGNLFGTTAVGGANGFGDVYELER